MNCVDVIEKGFKFLLSSCPDQETIINKAKIVESLTTLQGLVTKASENVDAHVRSLKSDADIGNLPAFAHDATHKWLGPELGLRGGLAPLPSQVVLKLRLWVLLLLRGLL